jgi:hypothetical protein
MWPLTRELEAKAQAFNFDAGWRESPVPVGQFWIAPEAERWDSRTATTVETLVLSKAGSISVHPDDVPRPERYIAKTSGCCGPRPWIEPNLGCPCCGEAVGREWADCETRAEVRFDPDAVEFVEDDAWVSPDRV